MHSQKQPKAGFAIDLVRDTGYRDAILMNKAGKNTCGNSSVGRASASQAEGREFEPRLPLMLENQMVSKCSDCLVFFFAGRSFVSKKFYEDLLIRVANTYSFVNNRHLFSNAVTAGNKLG